MFVKVGIVRFLKFFTFDSWFDWLIAIYFIKGWKKIVFRGLYCLFCAYSFQFLFAICKALFCLQVDDFESFRDDDLYFYIFTRHVFNYDKIFLLSCFIFTVHLHYIFHFTAFRFVKLMMIEVDFLRMLIDFHFEHRFTLLDCLVNRYSWQEIERLCLQLSAKIKLPANLILNRHDVVYLLRLYKLIEYWFFFPLLALLFLVMLTFTAIWYCFMTLSFNTISQHVFFQTISIIGTISSVWIIVISILILKIYSRPWLGFSGQLMSKFSSKADKFSE